MINRIRPKLKVRPTRTPIHFARLFQYEGLKETRAKLNLSELHDASIFLFKHILHPGDVRWTLAKKYASIKKENNFSTLNLENGMRALYASKSQGKNKQYGASITGELHIRQLVRAMQNHELGLVAIGHKPILMAGSNKYRITFEQTKSIMKGLDSRGVPGSPEAMWQMQLWGEGKFLGRIGINFHSEKGQSVITVANIQGAKEAKPALEIFRERMKKDFGDYLISKLQETLGPKYEYRGVIPNGNNPTQYYMSFRKSKPKKLKLWSREIKTQLQDLRQKK